MLSPQTLHVLFFARLTPRIRILLKITFFSSEMIVSVANHFVHGAESRCFHCTSRIGQIADFVHQIEKPPVLGIKFVNANQQLILPFLLRLRLESVIESIRPPILTCY